MFGGITNLFKRAPTDEEKDARVLELREALSKDPEMQPDDYSDDLALRRFLIARDYDVNKALALYTADIKWRREHKPQDVTADQCQNIINTGVAFWHGTDREGRPILYMRDRYHITENRSLDEMRLFCQHLMEEGIRNMGEGVYQFRVIQNQTGFSRSNMDQAAAKIVIETLQDHYPERLYKAHVINYGMLFWVLWKLVSVFMTKRTVEKVIHHGSDWKDKLREVVEPEQLLVDCGGLNTYHHPYPKNQEGEDVPVVDVDAQ